MVAPCCTGVVKAVVTAAADSVECMSFSPSNRVHGRARNGDSLKGVVKHRCDEKAPPGVSPWRTALVDTTPAVPDRL
jgi:hypothetical protein